MCVCVYTCVCVYIYMCVCVYIYIHRKLGGAGEAMITDEKNGHDPRSNPEERLFAFPTALIS